MAYKAAIFDLDGTLVDSLADLADTMNYALKILGQPTWDLDAYRQKVGNSTNLLIKRLLLPDKQYLFDEMYKIATEKYRQVYLNKTKPYKGIFETLKELHKRKIKLAVLTNKDQDMADKVVANILDKNLFDAVVGTSTGDPIKPDVVHTLKLIEKLTLKTDEVIMIGDSDVDMQTAKQCGIFAVGVNWGFRLIKELQDNGADVIIDKPKEILKFFI